MKESSMEERLEQVLDRVIDWLKYEEAKNAALLTLDGVGLGVILQWLGMPSGANLHVWLRASQAALLLSLLVALSSFYPVLDGEWLKKPASWYRKRKRKKHPERKPSVLFFGDIAGSKKGEYLESFLATFDLSRDGTPVELDYAREIVTNSNITLLKLKIFELAFVIASAGFIVTCAAAFAHLLGMDARLAALSSTFSNSCLMSQFDPAVCSQ